jgi:hypothetical protein
MATIVPEGETIKQALRWISQEMEHKKKPDLTGLINEASLRFNLSPKDEEFIFAFYRER